MINPLLMHSAGRQIGRFLSLYPVNVALLGSCSFPVKLDEATRSGLPEFRSFATGLQHDKAAIVAAVSLPHSNGQTEDQITKLKLLKRSMHGRASFELLRRRVLLAV